MHYKRGNIVKALKNSDQIIKRLDKQKIVRQDSIYFFKAYLLNEIGDFNVAK